MNSDDRLGAYDEPALVGTPRTPVSIPCTHAYLEQRRPGVCTGAKLFRLVGRPLRIFVVNR